MNKITHQPSDEDLDDFCRDVVQMARASEEDINAALNAPFLYARLRARLAEAEAQPVGLARGTAKRWTWQWRWAMAGAAIALLAGASWLWMSARPMPAMVVQKQSGMSSVVADKTSGSIATEARQEKAKATKNVTPKKVHRRVPAPVKSAPVTEDTEVATDYLPLTYIANSDEQSGQVVRVEMPRSAMLALGLPVNTESNSELVKADVIVGDDGLALAIRFVR